jgi:hypothetical protein
MKRPRDGEPSAASSGRAAASAGDPVCIELLSSSSEDERGAEDSEDQDYSDVVEAGAPSDGACSIPKRRARARPKVTVVAYLDPDDVPACRGGPADDGTAAAAGGGEEASDKLKSVKARISKMLELGLHSGTSEAEAQQSMRQAQRLLAKYNLGQAEILREAGGKLENKGAPAVLVTSWDQHTAELRVLVPSHQYSAVSILSQRWRAG